MSRSGQQLVSLILVSVGVAALHGHLSGVGGQSRSAADSTVSLPFEMVNRHMVMHVSVNKSRPLAFVLDTGASAPIIKLDRAKELGLRLRGEARAAGAGPGTTIGAQVENATIAIPGVSGFSQPLTLALPLVNLSTGLGREIDGIIGSDFVRQFVVELDYQSGRITLHDKARFVYAGPGEAVPIAFNADRHPTLEAEVTPAGGAPIRGSFMLDTGSGGALVLHSPFVQKHALLGPNLKTEPGLGLMGAGGEISARIGRVAELKIGSYRLAAPVTVFSQDRLGAFANPALAGNIGMQIASRFKVFLDYERRRVILEPTSRLVEPFERGFTGFVVRAEGRDFRTFRIRQVVGSSPAAEAGLAAEDLIVAVDGRDSAALSLGDLLEMFDRPVAYTLTIRRGEQTLKVTLTPRPIE
jgi:hypothetical protein